jgi:deoxyribonuclease V
MQQSWPETATEAIALQQQLRHHVRLENDGVDVELIAGVDVSFRPATNMVYGVIVLMQRAMLLPLEVVTAELPATFPYVPGLLSFREIPVLLAAMEKLTTLPDLLMVDGMGIAHPRRFGIAAHLGVLCDLPAIGVGKSRLCGKYEPLGDEKGATSALMDKGEHIGTVLRSKQGCNPLFISPGHRIDHETALAVTLNCLSRYRLPEPTRVADKLSKAKPAKALLV